MFSRTYSSTSGSPAPRRLEHAVDELAREARPAAGRDDGRGTRSGRTLRGSASGVGLASSQHETSLEPRSQQALRGLRRRSRSSTAAASRRNRARTAPRAATSSAARRNESMLPRPPHWATSRPPGFILRCSAANSASWSAIQWNVAFEKTRRPARAATAQPGPDTARSRGRPAPRGVLDHRRRDVDRVHRAVAAPRRRARAVTLPEPQPASSTTSSPCSASRSSCSTAHASCGSETRS